MLDYAKYRKLNEDLIKNQLGMLSEITNIQSDYILVKDNLNKLYKAYDTFMSELNRMKNKKFNFDKDTSEMISKFYNKLYKTLVDFPNNVKQIHLALADIEF